MLVALLTTDHIIGSDALVPLDGRWNAASIDWHVRRHIETLRHVQPHRVFYGYTVHRGSLLTPRIRDVTFDTPVGFKPTNPTEGRERKGQCR